MLTAPNVQIIAAKPRIELERRPCRQLRVAAYCRVSTEMEEQQNSYQVQIEYHTEYIHSNKEWQLAGIFADEGISGTSTEKRTAFNRMIRQCKQKKIDLILCKSASRFARNTVDCLKYVRLLKGLGIGVIFEKENINTLTESSEFILALHSSFAQAESESISKNVSLGVQMAFREGKVRYQFKHWLGYRKGADGKPEIIPEEAETVREIFDLFLDGHALRNIAQRLTAEGRPNAIGAADWNMNTIRRILTNEKYAGDALLQKTFTVDCISHKQQKNNGERTMYLVSNAHPAIIEREVFNLAQQELARRNAKRRVSTKAMTEQGKYSSKFALTELLICGECGTPYRRCSWNIRGKKRKVWRCLNRLENGTKYCKESPTLDEPMLQRTILQAVNDFYDCGDALSDILLHSTESVLQGQSDDEMQAIKRRLSEIDKARTEFISLIASGTLGEDALDAEFRNLYEEEQQLNERLTALQSKSQADSTAQHQLEAAAQEIRQADFQLTDYDNILVRRLIECIRVQDKEHVRIIFKGGTEITADLRE